ncbi:hypothetical protein ABT69_17180 [Salmonella enterica subsp. enterica serovar Typhimurium]|nr:hypothetical protein ABT69_17180 [Salmonella enterica subsp. enterica serovar Typhimurium]
MILVIIINSRGETMLQRTLGSGWGVLLPGVIIVGLAFIGLSADALKLLIVSGLRHFVLLPSCIALIGGMMLAMMNWNQG